MDTYEEGKGWIISTHTLSISPSTLREDRGREGTSVLYQGTVRKGGGDARIGRVRGRRILQVQSPIITEGVAAAAVAVAAEVAVEAATAAAAVLADPASVVAAAAAAAAGGPPRAPCHPHDGAHPPLLLDGEAPWRRLLL
jgi:hypothetical protein